MLMLRHIKPLFHLWLYGKVLFCPQGIQWHWGIDLCQRHTQTRPWTHPAFWVVKPTAAWVLPK